MNILHTVHSTDPRKGGVIESVVLFTQALKEQGHASEILSLDPPQTQHKNTQGMTVYSMGPGIGNYGYSGQFSPWIRENHSRFDAVIIHGIWQYHAAGTWLALKNTKVPYYILPQGMLDPWFNKKHKAKHLKKWIYWKLIEQRVFRDARRILFTCKKESQLAFKSFHPCNTPREITSLGVRAPEVGEVKAKETFLKKYPHLKDKRSLLYIGRIDKKKGIELLIEAFNQIACDKKIHDLHMQTVP